MSTPPTPPTGDSPGRDRTPLERVADDVETWFNAMRPQRTLTDEETATVFVRSVDVFSHVLKGASVQGIIGEDERTSLEELLDALRQAPGLV